MVVRVGFLAEGGTEKLLLDSPAFRQWAKQHGLYICDPVIDVEGKGNFTPKNIQEKVKACRIQTKPDKIVVLTDLEDDPCVTKARERLGVEYVDLVCLARKALESWYLADTEALQQWLKQKIPPVPSPELAGNPMMPWDFLKHLAQQHQARGPGESKAVFTKRMLNHYGFSLPRAAEHPACPSAGYFLNKLQTLCATGDAPSSF